MSEVYASNIMIINDRFNSLATWQAVATHNRGSGRAAVYRSERTMSVIGRLRCSKNLKNLDFGSEKIENIEFTKWFFASILDVPARPSRPEERVSQVFTLVMII